MGSVALEGFGGGSNPLNFKIVPYATEEELLAASPKENTVGIVTTDTITSWIFSATEPTEPMEGMVWITTGISSSVEFNALKKNGIQVYPTSAKQHISGAWVDKNAKSYQGGKWADWMYVILGDGGTVIGDFNTIQSGYGGSASLSGDRLTLSVKEGFPDKGASILALYRKTSFHGYKTLEATFSSSYTEGASFEIGIASAESSTALNVTKKTVAGSTGGIKLICDISGVEEGYAGVRFYTAANKGQRDVNVTNWKLY